MSGIRFFPEKCTECKACILKCSFVKEQEYNPDLSRLRIVSNWPDYPDLKICQQCEDAPCIEACAVGAISREGGWVTIDREACINCGACIRVCPYGAIHKFNGRVLICDTCQGEYPCTTVCSTGALCIFDDGSRNEEGGN